MKLIIIGIMVLIICVLILVRVLNENISLEKVNANTPLINVKEILINDDGEVDSEEIIDILEPLYKKVSFNSYLEYKKTMNSFTEQQQIVFVLDCYQGEVNNGGHDQFFYNPTGIVWEDAKRALEHLDCKEELSILSEALTLFDNSCPSFDWNERQYQLEKIEGKGLDFDKLDDKFYEQENLDEKLQIYINKNRNKFYI